MTYNEHLFKNIFDFLIKDQILWKPLLPVKLVNIEHGR